LSFQQIVLCIGALTFAGFGVLLFVAPQKLETVELGVTTANARSEVRAMYSRWWPQS
jgi:ABC-type dipeptide/oligopeptide/nickel transport system permease subunit